MRGGEQAPVGCVGRRAGMEAGAREEQWCLALCVLPVASYFRRKTVKKTLCSNRVRTI
jgi:hypothetical protein